MSKTVDETVSDSSKHEQDNSEQQLLYDATQKDLDRQIEVIGILDNKSAILVAVDVGVLLLASSSKIVGVSQGLAIAAFTLIVLGLCASVVAILPLPLHLYLRRSLLNALREERLIDESQKVLEQLIDHDIYNRRVITWKLWSTATATVFSVLGFVLVGVAYIIDAIVP